MIGEYFIDDSCISCAACWKEAPKNVSSHPVHTYAYICKQPENNSERDVCDRALKVCPVNAIGIVCNSSR
ncbi:MAG: ferredoxin [Bdellovibrionales bacterium]